MCRILLGGEGGISDTEEAGGSSVGISSSFGKGIWNIVGEKVSLLAMVKLSIMTILRGSVIILN